MTATTAAQLVEEVREAIRLGVGRAGSTQAVDPGHRVPFHWPPHLVSADYHILPHDWRERTTFEIEGEAFDVELAPSPVGYFGRIVGVWNEAKADSPEAVLEALRQGVQPLFSRQRAAAEALGLPGRFTGKVADLGPGGLLRLLYCRERDVAHEAMTCLEAHASTSPCGPALVAILEDDRHPYRRSAQWCVLDMFEDLPAFCPDEETQTRAVEAIRRLVMAAEDDYCRTVFKAGVVLGGHVCTDQAADALLACILDAGPIGRRSAMHAVFHLAEWRPDDRPRIVAALRQAAEVEPLPVLRAYAASMARDVESGGPDHVAEPPIPGEP
jgi:hypothetical protein